MLAHDDLPLPDYDHLTLGSLRSRLRALTPAHLEQVLAYERAHANRLQVVRMFENRLAKLAALEAADAAPAKTVGGPA